MNNFFDPITKIFSGSGGQIANGVQQTSGFSQTIFGELNHIFGPDLPYIKMISFALSGLLIYGIIYTVSKSGYAAIRTDNLFDALRVGDIFKRRSIRVWVTIKKMAKSKKPNDWRQAIFRAEELLNVVLKQAGFLGANFEERISTLNVEQLSNVADVKKAHERIEKLKNDLSLEVVQEEVEALLDIFETSFQDLALID